MKDKDKEPRKALCVNRNARHAYEIIETIETGIVLGGPEVKSLRNGGATSGTAMPR